MAEVSEIGRSRRSRNASSIPRRGKSVVASGMVGGIAVRGGHVAVTLEVDPARGAALEPLRQACEQAVRAMPGVLSATAVMTAERAAPRRRRHAPGRATVMRHSARPRPPQTTGGGGRIDVAGREAHHRRRLGQGRRRQVDDRGQPGARPGRPTASATGLLDADIYGPSMPRMLGVKEKPESPDGKTLKPIERYGLRTMSIGYIVAEDTPMIWRGPMVSSALEQMLRDVQWGELDVLVVDMPPGTGDAQLTMAQRVPLSGAVIVSTPQDIALIDARKGLNMFRKVAVPVLGIVENMSYFLCPKCGERVGDLRPWRRPRGGREARRAVPGRGAAASRHPHHVGQRPSRSSSPSPTARTPRSTQHRRPRLEAAHRQPAWRPPPPHIVMR